MKSYIKTLASLLVVLAFTACNDFDDFDRGLTPVEMPEIALGYYTANYNADNKYEYAAVITEDAQGNKVIYTLRTGKPETKDSALVRTTGVFANPEYDEKIGALTGVMTKVEDTFYEDTTQVVLAYSYDGTTLYYEVSAGNSRESASLSRSTAYPPVNGKWTGANADGSVKVDLFFEDGDSTCLVNEEEILKCKTEGGVTTLSDGTTLTYNDKYQVVYNDGTNSFVLDRKCSDPEPEVFAPIYEGRYIHAATVLDGKPLFDQGFEATLYQSQKDPNRFVLAPFYNNGEGMLIVMGEENTITFDAYLGLDDQNYGPIFFTDLATVGAQSAFPDNVSHYDTSAGIMYLDGGYNVAAGFFCLCEDIFKVTAEATNKKHFVRKQTNTTVSKNPFTLNPAITFKKK